MRKALIVTVLVMLGVFCTVYIAQASTLEEAKALGELETLRASL